MKPSNVEVSPLYFKGIDLKSFTIDYYEPTSLDCLASLTTLASRDTLESRHVHDSPTDSLQVSHNNVSTSSEELLDQIGPWWTCTSLGLGGLASPHSGAGADRNRNLDIDQHAVGGKPGSENDVEAEDDDCGNGSRHRRLDGLEVLGVGSPAQEARLKYVREVVLHVLGEKVREATGDGERRVDRRAEHVLGNPITVGRCEHRRARLAGGEDGAGDGDRVDDALTARDDRGDCVAAAEKRASACLSKCGL